jgi:hypothetical protein
MIDEEILRSVGIRKINPLNKTAIPPTIIATPIVFIYGAQNGYRSWISEPRKESPLLRCTLPNVQRLRLARRREKIRRSTRFL